MRLLLVEDDADLSKRLKTSLNKLGYAVDVAENGIDAEHFGRQESYDLVILDLGLPQRSGLEVLQNWRTDGLDFPVLVLTARDAWHERVDGFKAGADDYLGKPFHFEELSERIKALIRRNNPASITGMEFGQFCLHEEQQMLKNISTDETFQLTGTEFRLLRYFLMHRNVVLSKSRLMEHVYEYDDDKDSNVMEVYVTRLRKIVGKKQIKTRRGQGYVFESDS